MTEHSVIKMCCGRNAPDVLESYVLFHSSVGELTARALDDQGSVSVVTTQSVASTLTQSPTQRAKVYLSLGDKYVDA